MRKGIALWSMLLYFPLLVCSLDIKEYLIIRPNILGKGFSDREENQKYISPIELGFILEDLKEKNETSGNQKIIKKALLFFRDRGNLKLLAEYSVDGIYDSGNKLVVDVKRRIGDDKEILGYTLDLLVSPNSPKLVLRDKKKRNVLETDPVAFFMLDPGQMALKKYIPEL